MFFLNENIMVTNSWVLVYKPGQTLYKINEPIFETK